MIFTTAVIPALPPTSWSQWLLYESLWAGPFAWCILAFVSALVAVNLPMAKRRPYWIGAGIMILLAFANLGNAMAFDTPRERAMALTDLLAETASQLATAKTNDPANAERIQLIQSQLAPNFTLVDNLSGRPIPLSPAQVTKTLIQRSAHLSIKGNRVTGVDAGQTGPDQVLVQLDMRTDIAANNIQLPGGIPNTWHLLWALGPDQTWQLKKATLVGIAGKSPSRFAK